MLFEKSRNVDRTFRGYWKFTFPATNLSKHLNASVDINLFFKVF